MNHRPEMYANALGEVKDDPMVMTIAFAGAPNLAADKMSKIHLKGLDREIDDCL